MKEKKVILCTVFLELRLILLFCDYSSKQQGQI